MDKLLPVPASDLDWAEIEELSIQEALQALQRRDYEAVRKYANRAEYATNKRAIDEHVRDMAEAERHYLESR